MIFPSHTDSGRRIMCMYINRLTYICICMIYLRMISDIGTLYLYHCCECMRVMIVCDMSFRKKPYFASVGGWVSCQASIVDASLATGGLGGARRGGGPMRVASIGSETF